MAELKQNFKPIYNNLPTYRIENRDGKFYTIPIFENIVKIIQNSLIIHETNKNFFIDMLNFYNGMTQTDDTYMQSTEQKYDNKWAVNYTKVLIDCAVAIEMNAPFIYSLIETKNAKYKKDIDVIKKYIINEGLHNIDLDTGLVMKIAGLCYNYCLQQNIKNDKTIFSPFTVGIFEPKDTFVCHSNEIGNKINFSAHITTIKDENNQEVIRYTCFDDKHKYIIEQGATGFYFVKQQVIGINGEIIEQDYIAHDLPYNPIQLFANGRYFDSVVFLLKDLQTSLNVTETNVNNDMYNWVDKLLVFLGVDIEGDELVKLRMSQIIKIPQNAMGTNQDAKYISAQMDYQGVINRKQSIIDDMYFFASVPTNKSNRAETGKAAALTNGHTQSNFSANRREQAFIQPKRQQLANIIEILRRTNMIASDITANDISIEFDKSRLTTDLETIQAISECLKMNMPPYEVIQKFNFFNNIEQIVKAMSELINLERKYQLQLAGVIKVDNNEYGGVEYIQQNVAQTETMEVNNAASI